MLLATHVYPKQCQSLFARVSLSSSSSLLLSLLQGGGVKLFTNAFIFVTSGIKDSQYLVIVSKPLSFSVDK